MTISTFEFSCAEINVVLHLDLVGCKRLLEPLHGAGCPGIAEVELLAQQVEGADESGEAGGVLAGQQQLGPHPGRGQRQVRQLVGVGGVAGGQEPVNHNRPALQPSQNCAFQETDQFLK